MKLYSYWRSSASFRVRIALHLKGVQFEYVPVHLLRAGGEQYTAAYRALNPESRVPSLEVDGHVLTQSMAILEWLEERYPTPALLPADLSGRARVRGLAQLIVADIQPLQNSALVRYLRDTLGADERAAAGWLEHWIDRGFSALEERLGRDAGTGRFCHGDRPSLADVCLVPQCASARRFGVDPARYPRISAIEAACRELPAFEAAAPDRQPDAGT
jgi:maleylacetoacetate isomerase